MTTEFKTRDTIIRLLSNMGSQKEVHQYLRRFSELDSNQFAVVKVGGAILRDEMEALASALAFLQRVGLTPIVIHGAGPQLNASLEQAGIKPEFVDGLRVTTPDVLYHARKVMQKLNLELVETLQAMDTRATSITDGVFDARLVENKQLGLVGEVSGVNLGGISMALKARSIPVLSCLGVSESGQIVNINADMAAQELVRTVKPYKIIFLTGTGGLLDESGELISTVNLTTDFDDLISQDWVHGGMALKLRQIQSLLQDLPLSSSVSITRPKHLAKELFTHRGAGTLIRMGEKIFQYNQWDDVDLEKLTRLIESAFGRKLDQDYFQNTHLYRLYVSESCRAAALLTLENGIPHLDKFVVEDEARGEGLGRAVWQQMKNENPKLFWRARQANVVSSFYFQEADGGIKRGDWTVFWYGLDSYEQIQACVELAAAKKASI